MSKNHVIPNQYKRHYTHLYFAEIVLRRLSEKIGRRVQQIRSEHAQNLSKNDYFLLSFLINLRGKFHRMLFQIRSVLRCLSEKIRGRVSQKCIKSAQKIWYFCISFERSLSSLRPPPPPYNAHRQGSLSSLSETLRLYIL